ncbi:hypothetical protein R50072_11150 [Simiduia litorea]
MQDDGQAKTLFFAQAWGEMHLMSAQAASKSIYMDKVSSKLFLRKRSDIQQNVGFTLKRLDDLI